MGQIFIPGTATPDKVLTGSTFSAGANYQASGTMVNNGAVTITPGFTAKTIPAGYHNGSGVVSGDSNLASGNIRAGVSIFGVQGSSTVVNTADAVLDPAFLVQGYSGYDDGVKKAGNMIDRSGQNWHQRANNATMSSAAEYGVYLQPPAGRYDGNSWVYYPEPNLVASNIVAGKNIYGINGTFNGKRWASGFAGNLTINETFRSIIGNNVQRSVIHVTGLSFLPTVILVHGNDSGMDLVGGVRTTGLPDNFGYGSPIMIAGTYIDMFFLIRDNPNSFVRQGEFRLPVMSGSNISWVAFE